LVTFQPPNKWQTIDSIPATRDRLLPEFTAAASAMIAFDTWIDNTDRLNGGNPQESPHFVTGTLLLAGRL
jgi:hypothetical protein